MVEYKSICLVKHDGNINFLINQKTSMQETAKVLVFSRQEKSDIPDGNWTPVSRL